MKESLLIEDRERRGSRALDQWRGLALILVLINHGFYFTGRTGGIGRVGVNLFFFISGILVFRSLERSRARGDWDRARAFWWRRLRRLYPALIAYIAAMGLITWVLAQFPSFRVEADPMAYLRNVPIGLAYLVDYAPEGLPLSLGHLWSLGCEMQFYLLAPLLWMIAGREPGRFVVFFVVLAILMTLGAAQPFIGKWKYHFEFAVWPMMLGFFCEYKKAWLLQIPDQIVTIVLWCSIFVCGAAMVLMLIGMEMKVMVIAIGALLLLPCLLAYLFGRSVPGWLGYGMEWMGVRTYSIYLWQQPLAFCYFLPAPLHPIGAVAATVFGSVWYRWFEFPFLSAARQKQERAREIS